VRRLFRNQIELSADDRSVVTEIRRRSPAGRLVVTDLPDLAYLARRQVPGKLVDTAVLRFDAGYLSVRDVEREIATRQVDVVVAGRAFTQYPALMQWLGTHFARRAQHGDVAVFSRD
jgi:hypothetical protein